ncbi:putative aminophospholipid-translocase [Marasmius sp. AFHP31]|nr:putative aminophospholipid-translocase [Marasmius sp. AFHP31]
MPDIPLHSLRRGAHKSVPIPDDESQAGKPSSTPNKMNRAGRAAVAASSSRRIFSGNKRAERCTDDLEEATGLLAADDRDTEDDGVQEPSCRRSRNPLQYGNLQGKTKQERYVSSDLQIAKFPVSIIRNQKYDAFTFMPFYEQFNNPNLESTAFSTSYLDRNADTRFVPSSFIRVGDLIRLEEDQRVPADLVLLKTSDTFGTCFIRTDQLDGETDVKLRVAVPKTQKLEEADLVRADAEVYADAPVKDIHSFIRSRSIPLFPPPLPPRGMVQGRREMRHRYRRYRRAFHRCRLRTCFGHSVGCWIGGGISCLHGTRDESGHEDESSGDEGCKLDLEVNGLAKVLCTATEGFNTSMCLVGVKILPHACYYPYRHRVPVDMQSTCPSLRVNLDMGKTVYASQIMNNEEIPNTIVRMSTLPEELGRTT